MAKRKTFTLNKNLQEGLSQTMNAVKSYAGELHFEIIPLAQIEFDTDNPRELHLDLADLPRGPAQKDSLYEIKMQEIQSLNSLAETINNQGLLNPIIVYKNGTRYQLVAGERRCLASKIAGKIDIKANVLSERPTHYRRKVLQWIENMEREDLTLWERIQNVKSIVGAYLKESDSSEDVTASLIKNLLGCSLPHAMNYHAILNGSVDLSALIREGRIKNIEKAALIAKTQNKHLSQKLMDICLEEGSLKQMKAELKKHSEHAKLMQRQQLQSSLASGRGRKLTKVNLGSINDARVVQIMIDAVLAQEGFHHYRSKFENVDWSNYADSASAFKQLVSIIKANLAPSSSNQ